MPFDYGLRLHNRQRLANARAKPIEANENQSVDGAEGLFLRSGSPQNVYLLPQHPNFHLKRCPRPKQICDHPNNEPDKISHPARASPDSRSTASQVEFAIGTTSIFALCLLLNDVAAHSKGRRQSQGFAQKSESTVPEILDLKNFRIRRFSDIAHRL